MGEVVSLLCGKTASIMLLVHDMCYTDTDMIFVQLPSQRLINGHAGPSYAGRHGKHGRRI